MIVHSASKEVLFIHFNQLLQSIYKKKIFSYAFVEPIEISFALENTIKPPITFDDINLLWTFTNQNGEVFTNGNLFKNDSGIEDRSSVYNIVASTFIKQIKLNEHEKKVVVMKLTPHHIGSLDIQAVVGKLVSLKK